MCGLPSDWSCPFSATLSRAFPGVAAMVAHCREDALDHRAWFPRTLPILHLTKSNSGKPSPVTSTRAPPPSGTFVGCTSRTTGRGRRVASTPVLELPTATRTVPGRSTSTSQTTKPVETQRPGASHVLPAPWRAHPLRRSLPATCMSTGNAANPLLIMAEAAREGRCASKSTTLLSTLPRARRSGMNPSLVGDTEHTPMLSKLVPVEMEPSPSMQCVNGAVLSRRTVVTSDTVAPGAGASSAAMRRGTTGAIS